MMDYLNDTDYDGGVTGGSESLLAQHLDALLAGAPTLSYQQSADPDTLELMGLAATLSVTLTPMLPDAEFVARLKTDLIGQNDASRTGFVLRWRAIPAQYRLFARLGGATLGAGLALFALRRAVGFLANGRQRTEPEGKPTLPN